jgi:hypothetical protein
MTNVWTDTQWEAFALLLEEAWPGEFEDATRQAWRVLLDQTTPEQATIGLRKMLLEGRRFRPSVSELLAAVHADPSQPTFDEAWMIIRRALSAPGLRVAIRDYFARTGRAFVDEDTGRQMHAAARHQALDGAHVLVQRFVGLQGWERLAAALDEEWGAARRVELRKAWEAMVDAGDTRAVAAIASGRPDALRRLDPIGALGIVPARELAASTTSTTKEA